MHNTALRQFGTAAGAAPPPACGARNWRQALRTMTSEQPAIRIPPQKGKKPAPGSASVPRPNPRAWLAATPPSTPNRTPLTRSAFIPRPPVRPPSFLLESQLVEQLAEGVVALVDRLAAVLRP